MGRVLMSYFASQYVRFVTELMSPTRHWQAFCLLPSACAGDHRLGPSTLPKVMQR